MPVKVLFIAGWGRSGTTVLDNVLGAHDGVFGTGELFHLWEWAFLDGRRCGCLAPQRECAVWRAILDSAFGDDLPDPAGIVALQRRSLAVRHTPALLAGRATSDVARYTEILRRLYTGMADATGSRIVVDSSKRPPDAVLAGRVPGIEPYLLHMVRDPRAVGFSWQRHKAFLDTDRREELHRHGLLMNAAHWLSWNAGAEIAASCYPQGRYRRLRYEDFTADPAGTVDRIFAMLGEPTPPGPFLDRHTVELPVNHTVAGNPGRHRTGPTRIAPDDAWICEQRRSVRLGTTALTLPMLGRYRYGVRRPARVDARCERTH